MSAELITAWMIDGARVPKRDSLPASLGKLNLVSEEIARSAAPKDLPEVLFVRDSDAALVKTVRAQHHWAAVAIVGSAEDPAARALLYQAGCDHVLPTTPAQGELEALLDRLREQKSSVRELLALRSELARVAGFNADLTALLVHDLKNPLAVVASNLRYAADVVAEENGDPELLSALADSRSATQRLVLMLGVVLDVARAEAGQLGLSLGRANLVAFLNKRIGEQQRAATERGIQLSLAETTPVEITYPFDREVLGRVVDQLLEGSLRYTPRGGRIEAGARPLPDGALELWISNTGPPVPVEWRKTLFEKFAHVGSRSDNRLLNLGIGLYFCRLAVNAHGGSVVCEEREQWPTSFRITLPARIGDTG